MSRPASMLDFVTRSRWFQRNGLRRVTFAVVALVLIVLCLVPRQQVASMTLAPQETNTAGLQAILTQLGGNYAAFLGAGEPVEVDLAIARSHQVQKSVVRFLGNKAGEGSDQFQDALRKVADETSVRAVRGNLLQITARSRSADHSLNTVRAYSRAMQVRLAELSRTSTDLKQSILDRRFQESTDRLDRAEAAIGAFRSANKLVEPETQMGMAIGQLASLQGQLQAKQVQLKTTLQFNTPNSYAARTIQVEIAALRNQISTAEAKVRAGGGMTAAGIAPKSLEFQRLDRELKFAQALHDSYERYLEGTAIENLTADYNLRVIEPAYIEPGFHFNRIPAVLLALLVLFAIASEFIVMRPPPGIFARET